MDATLSSTALPWSKKRNPCSFGGAFGAPPPLDQRSTAVYLCFLHLRLASSHCCLEHIHDCENRRKSQKKPLYLHSCRRVLGVARCPGNPPIDQAILAVMISKERAVEEKRLVRKLDFRFIPIMILLYIMSDVDRNAIATARLKGLEHDLGLSDTQYDTAVVGLFILYIPAQIPFSMILNRVSRPSLYIGISSITGGIICGLMGITKNYGGILTCRIFLGLPEAAYVPGVFYLLSSWYTRKELALRTSLMLAGGMVSHAFGSLIAAAILSNMEGVYGIRGWQWTFIIDGVITVAIGILSLWALPDLPANTRWMSHAEQRLAQVRLAEDAGEADENLSEDSLWSGMKMVIKDVKVFAFSLILMGNYVGLAFTHFFPTLTKTLGYDDTVTLLVSAPPWIFAAIICTLNGFHSDKTGERFFHAFGMIWSTIAGFIIAVSTLSTGGRFFSLFLLSVGRGSHSIILAWVSNSIPRPPAKRAAAIGVVGGFGNAGNFIGSYIWKNSWAPGYRPSMVISIAALTLSSTIAFLMRCKLKRLNKKLDEDETEALKGVNRKRVEDAACLEGITLDEALEKRKGFRYIY
ncbi:hypothetical protein ACEPAH_7376 [Sanghuangporus vaninii]